MNKYIFFILISLFSLNLISAIQIGNVGEEGVNFKKATSSSINYSTVNVNNSDYLDGHDSDYFCVNTSLSDYVPYTGATSNVNLGTKSMTAGSFVTTTMFANYFREPGMQGFQISAGCFGSNTCVQPISKDVTFLGSPTTTWQGVYSDFYYGNGSLLTDVCLSNGTGCQASSGGMNYTNVALTNTTNNFTANQIINANLNITYNLTIGIGGCKTWWNGSCEIKSCPTTKNFYC